MVARWSDEIISRRDDLGKWTRLMLPPCTAISFFSSMSVILLPLYPFNHMVQPATTSIPISLPGPLDDRDSRRRLTEDPTLNHERLLFPARPGDPAFPLDRLGSRRKLLLQLLIPGRVVIFSRNAILGATAIRDLMPRCGRDDMLRAINHSRTFKDSLE